jgi:hypothetical protein
MYAIGEEPDANADTQTIDPMIFALAAGPRNIYECIHMVHNSRTGHQGIQATWLTCKKTFPNAAISYEASIESKGLVARHTCTHVLYDDIDVFQLI